jgi:hypothetical protein
MSGQTPATSIASPIITAPAAMNQIQVAPSFREKVSPARRQQHVEAGRPGRQDSFRVEHHLAVHGPVLEEMLHADDGAIDHGRPLPTDRSAALRIPAPARSKAAASS